MNVRGRSRWDRVPTIRCPDACQRLDYGTESVDLLVRTHRRFARDADVGLPVGREAVHGTRKLALDGLSLLPTETQIADEHDDHDREREAHCSVANPECPEIARLTEPVGK
jgi:hypothetical protein